MLIVMAYIFALKLMIFDWQCSKWQAEQKFSYFFTQLGLDVTLAASFCMDESAKRMIEMGQFYHSATIYKEII